VWRQIVDLRLNKVLPVIRDIDVNGLNEFFISPGLRTRNVAFYVLFHDFTPFLFPNVSGQEVAEAIFSINSEAIGLDMYQWSDGGEFDVK
jgi:hypothetical protein